MNKLKSFFDEDSMFVFISSVITMIIAHGFCFANLMFSHDSLKFYFSTEYRKVALGRWLYPLFGLIRGMAYPWVMGCFSVLYVSLAVVIVTKTLEFSRMQGLCVVVVFSTNITLTALFCTYLYDADADCLALLLSCLAVYGFRRLSKMTKILVPSIFLVLCLALYQSYICVAIGLFLLILIAF